MLDTHQPIPTLQSTFVSWRPPLLTGVVLHRFMSTWRMELIMVRQSVQLAVQSMLSHHCILISIDTLYANVGRAPMASPLYRCETCLKVFSRGYTLRRHQAIHGTLGDKYECDICNASFDRNDRLTRHRKIHTGKDLRDCGYCGKQSLGGSDAGSTRPMALSGQVDRLIWKSRAFVAC